MQNSMMADYKVITPDFINVHISTSKDDISFSEKRFPKNITVGDLKAKLELMTGANCQTMKIECYDKDGKFLCGLCDDGALLGSYPLDDGSRLHIIDSFIVRNELDFGKVEKYEMPEETYSRRTDSVRSFLVKNKLGQYKEENQKKCEKQLEEQKILAQAITTGSRCKVSVADAPPKLGTVMYNGTVQGLSGYWIGVKYDEPVGKNDGTYKMKKYFECPQNYGAFVKPQYVVCGNFPEESYDLDEEI